MKFAKVIALLVVATSAQAQDSTLQAAGTDTPIDVFHNPCDRGPFPWLGSINSYRSDFVSFLMDRYESMSKDEAEYISYQLCDDLTLLDDSDALTRRLHLLLSKSGY